MSCLDRSRLPSPEVFYAAEGLELRGRGTWRTTECRLHGGSDSMRVNVINGAWVCMACGAKGGDVVAYLMAARELDFMAAARALDAWNQKPGDNHLPSRPTTLSARDAMTLIAQELGVVYVVLSDAMRGIVPTDEDWRRFIEASGRLERLAQEFRS